MRKSVKDDGVKYFEDDILYAYDCIFFWVKPEKILRKEDKNS